MKSHCLPHSKCYLGVTEGKGEAKCLGSCRQLQAEPRTESNGQASSFQCLELDFCAKSSSAMNMSRAQVPTH